MQTDWEKGWKRSVEISGQVSYGYLYYTCLQYNIQHMAYTPYPRLIQQNKLSLCQRQIYQGSNLPAFCFGPLAMQISLILSGNWPLGTIYDPLALILSSEAVPHLSRD
jgi:hypothetical protein